MKYYMVVINDRHSDERYYLYLDKEDAKNQCRKIMPGGTENNQYGDWCMYINDDYYSSVSEVSVQERDI